jgi:hypothetical protein
MTMSYWQTLKEWNTFFYALIWVLFCFPGFSLTSDFIKTLRRGDYSGSAGVLFAGIIWLVVLYFVIGTICHLYKLYNTPQK